MDKKLAGLLGTVAAAALCGAAPAAQAGPMQPDPLHVQSYAELLNPVENAVELLRADDEARGSQQAEFELVQYEYHHHHHHWYHHHHHHHNYWRYHHHHHHYYWRYHHHHHRYYHHHHHRYYRDGY